jgi:hypothetical protein
LLDESKIKFKDNIKSEITVRNIPETEKVPAEILDCFPMRTSYLQYPFSTGIPTIYYFGFAGPYETNPSVCF